MRRVFLFAAFLLLLGLTTATAASFDVQAEDITSFSTSTSISVPQMPIAPAGPLYIVGDPPVGSLVSTPPATVRGNEKTSFVPVATDVSLEQREPDSSGRSYWVSWKSLAYQQGLEFRAQTVTVYYERTSGDSPLRAGLFDCEASAPPATVDETTEDECRLLIANDSAIGAEEIVLGPFSNTVSPTNELRLKLVNAGNGPPPPAIQWGYREQNRSARIIISAATP